MSMHKLRKYLIAMLDRAEKVSDTFGGNTVALLTVSLLLAAAMLIVNDRFIVSTREKNEVLFILDKLLMETSKVQSNLATAESSQRGYLLTRSNIYFKPYDEATIKIGRQLQSINLLLNKTELDKHTEIQSTVTELISSVAKKSAEMSVTIDLAKKQEFDKALAVVRLDTGIKESRNIEMLSHRFEQQLLDYRSELEDSRNNIRRLMRWFVMACPLIFVSLMVLVIRRLLRELAEKASLYARLRDENAGYERNVQVLTQRLQRQALHAQTDIEHERYQLARELHDELGSLLTAIKMDISWVIKNLKDEMPQVVDKLKKTSQYLDRSINFKREIVQNLHPSMIESFGLIASLRNLVDEAAARNQWQMDVILPEQEMAINDTLGLIIYRLVQESLNNCSKYAKATQVSVHLMHDEYHIKLEVIDNGIGFDIENVASSSTGIRGMRNRVESIGGHFEMISAQEKGASTRVMLPVIAPENNLA